MKPTRPRLSSLVTFLNMDRVSVGVVHDYKCAIRTMHWKRQINNGLCNCPAASLEVIKESLFRRLEIKK